MSAATAAKSTATGANRRANPRLDVSSTLIGRYGGKQLELSLSNLSYGGAYFEFDRAPPAGSELELELQRGDDVAQSRARVVHSNGDGFAVHFIDPPIPFTSALSRLLTRRLMDDVDVVADGFDTFGRIAMLLQQGPDFEVLFTANMGQNGVWVLTDKIWAYSETLWITLLEHGMFDCEVRVIWCTEDAMALEFIDPSKEFRRAYQRVLDSFLG